MTRDLVLENVRHAAEHDEPLTLSADDAVTVHAELVRLTRALVGCRRELEQLRGAP